jgi:cytochrome c oxidase assembly factor CtaG
MTALVFVLVLLLSAQPAAAHGDGALWSGPTWTYDPFVVIPLYVSAALYFIGTQRLWRRAGFCRGVHQGQAMSFWLGWLTLAVALISPLHWTGERLFTAHMIEHGMVMAVAAPLIAFARPVGAMAWAVPQRVATILGSAGTRVTHWRLWRFVSHPVAAALVHGVAIWAWHAPVLYQAALDHVWVHRLQHASFFVTALLFWWSLWHGRLRERGYGIAVFCLFITSVHTGVLGILLTLSRHLWYPQQGTLAAEFGLTPLEDQQLAGLVMGVPMGLIYTAAALALAARWIVGSSNGLGAGHAAAAR